MTKNMRDKILRARTAATYKLMREERGEVPIPEDDILHAVMKGLPPGPPGEEAREIWNEATAYEIADVVSRLVRSRPRAKGSDPEAVQTVLAEWGEELQNDFRVTRDGVHQYVPLDGLTESEVYAIAEEADKQAGGLIRKGRAMRAYAKAKWPITNAAE